jgi:ABC-type oligopeptide transport system substrate-binding subunit
MMSRTLAKLLCLAALSALAIPAYAQTDTKSTGQVAQGTTPPASTAPAAPSGNAMTPEEKAAKAACDAKTGADKEKCLKDVEAKYGKTAGQSGDMSTKPAETPKK